MSRWHPKRCRVCGLQACEAEPISALGFCSVCGPARQNANNEQMTTREGPFYEHWVYRSALASRRRLVALNEAKG